MGVTVVGILAIFCFSGTPWVLGAESSLLLLDLKGADSQSRIKTAYNAKAESVQNDQGQSILRVQAPVSPHWPGITLPAPNGVWDLSNFAAVEIKVRNTGQEPLPLGSRVDNAGADGSKNCATAGEKVAPGETVTLRLPLGSAPWRLSKPLKLNGMRGAPAFNEPIDPAKVTQILVFLNNPKTEHTFEILGIRAVGQAQTLDSDTFIPFIDCYGQFKHATWPGKIQSDADFQTRQADEEKDLRAYPGSEAWDKWGGWAKGPQLKATGFFRVEKKGDTWWLVDPDGRLFWSHGVDCVTAGNAVTPVTDRESYFTELPQAGSPFERFYGTASWAPHGFYKGKSSYRTFNFTASNLQRKYGAESYRAFADLAHRRLRSWGMNTIANWSDASIFEMRRTPYTQTVHINNPPLLEGSEGYWGKFYDVFDPAFREQVRRGMEGQRGKSAGDPWCLGYFVDNELSWGGNDLNLAKWTIASPAGQKAKLAFLDDLKAKYGTVDKLNAAWGTSHASWEAWIESRAVPESDGAKGDLGDFSTRMAETYFQVCREEVKRVAPDTLYLGCRFAEHNDRAVRAAAKSCDVISFNFYTENVVNVKLPDGVDKPIVVGEFHFGALDRGMFHTGLRGAANQEERAWKYKNYVEGALRHPNIVGTHWFQYGDQATTGRGDGENYQIGFLDVCDTPYPEIVQASREVGEELYSLRK